MTKIIDRMMMRELIGPVANSSMMFLVILFSSTYMMKLTDMLSRGASISLVAQATLYCLPQLVTQTLPMGMLLGTIMAVGRISGDSEHIALFAGGISFYRLAVPVGVLGLIISITAIIWNETVVPPATDRFLNLTQKLLDDVKSAGMPIDYRVRTPGTDKVEEEVVIGGGYDAKTKSLRLVTITKFGADGRADLVLTAERAIPRDLKGQDWDFEDVTVHYLRPLKDGTVQAEISAKRMSTERIPGKVGLRRDFSHIMAEQITDNRRMTFLQLRDKIAVKRTRGDLTALIDEFDLWSKLSLPLAGWIFGLVAAPLGVRPPRSGKAMGFGIAIGVIFLFYVVHQSMFQFAKNGNMAPFAAAFVGDVLGMIGAIILMSRTRQ